MNLLTIGTFVGHFILLDDEIIYIGHEGHQPTPRILKNEVELLKHNLRERGLPPEVLSFTEKHITVAKFTTKHRKVSLVPGVRAKLTREDVDTLRKTRFRLVRLKEVPMDGDTVLACRCAALIQMPLDLTLIAAQQLANDGWPIPERRVQI